MKRTIYFTLLLVYTLILTLLSTTMTSCYKLTDKRAADAEKETLYVNDT